MGIATLGSTRRLIAGAFFALAITAADPAHAAPSCEPHDNKELCQIANEALADNPTFSQIREEGSESERIRYNRHAARRTKARAILERLPDPNWRDLYRAGYVIAYGTTPEEDMLAHAIAIRTLSLAPNEADARFLVAMTIDEIGRRYVGMQMYGRQKHFEFDPSVAAHPLACLPQMIEPPLPEIVGPQFHRIDGYERCAPGVGVQARRE